MSTSKAKIETALVKAVKVTKDSLILDLSDGRRISVPVEWYPRLEHATTEERKNWRSIGKGLGIHWEDLDEDISIDGLLAGRPSGESQSSFKSWLEKRPGHKTLNKIGHA